MGVATFLRLGPESPTARAQPGAEAGLRKRVARVHTGRSKRGLVAKCESGDYHSWRKKAFRSKPNYPGSTRSPQHVDPIDSEWQALQRSRNSAPDAGPASTSGRTDASNNYGYSVEDSWDTADDAYTPFPGKGLGPATGDNIALDQWSTSSSNMAATSELWNRVAQVFVILFGVGSTETEGIYSLRAVTGIDGLPVDTIIAFESSEDAERYAGLLEATMSRHIPKVCPIESKELLDFCADSGYNCRLEPSGSLLMPPEYNVGMTDWERSLRLRDGKFNVLDVDPEPGFVGMELESMDDQMQPSFEGPTLLNQAGTYFPADNQDLEELKARLEKLLP